MVKVLSVNFKSYCGIGQVTCPYCQYKNTVIENHYNTGKTEWFNPCKHLITMLSNTEIATFWTLPDGITEEELPIIFSTTTTRTIDLIKWYVKETGEKLQTIKDLQKVEKRYPNEWAEAHRREVQKDKIWGSLPLALKINRGINELAPILATMGWINLKDLYKEEESNG